MSEARLQKSIITYLRLRYPRVLFCASLGGQFQPYQSQRQKAKDTGYQPGFPDLFIYESKSKYHGLAIEIKTEKGRPTKLQKQWIDNLNSKGYCARICRGWNEIIQTIDSYMNEQIIDD